MSSDTVSGMWHSRHPPLWKAGSAFSLRPQLSYHLHQEAPDLPTWSSHFSQSLSITHTVSLLHLLLSEITCFIYLITCLFSLSPTHPHKTTTNSTLIESSCESLGSLHPEDAQYPSHKSCSLRIHWTNEYHVTHIFPRLVFCSLDPLIHFLFQLTQLHGCLVLGSEIQEDAHLLIMLLRMQHEEKFQPNLFQVLCFTNEEKHAI